MAEIDRPLNGFNNGRDTSDGIGGKPGPFEQNINYSHIEPDSHIFTDIDQILETLKYPGSFDRNYLIVGLENTRAQGYNLNRVVTKSTEELIDEYLTSDDIHKMD